MKIKNRRKLIWSVPLVATFIPVTTAFSLVATSCGSNVIAENDSPVQIAIGSNVPGNPFCNGSSYTIYQINNLLKVNEQGRFVDNSVQEYINGLFDSLPAEFTYSVESTGDGLGLSSAIDSSERVYTVNIKLTDTESGDNFASKKLEFSHFHIVQAVNDVVDVNLKNAVNNPFYKDGGGTTKEVVESLKVNDEGKFATADIQEYMDGWFLHHPISYAYSHELLGENSGSYLVRVILTDTGFMSQENPTFASVTFRFLNYAGEVDNNPAQAIENQQNPVVINPFESRGAQTMFSIDKMLTLENGRFVDPEVQTFIDSKFKWLPDQCIYIIDNSDGKLGYYNPQENSYEVGAILKTLDNKTRESIVLTFKDLIKPTQISETHILVDVSKVESINPFCSGSVKTLAQIKSMLSVEGGKFVNADVQNYVDTLFSSQHSTHHQYKVVNLNDGLKNIYRSDDSYVYPVQIQMIDDSNQLFCVEVKFTNFTVVTAKKLQVVIDVKNSENNPFYSVNLVDTERVAKALAINKNGRFSRNKVNAYITSLFTNIPTEFDYEVENVDSSRNDTYTAKVTLVDRFVPLNKASVTLCFVNLVSTDATQVKYNIVVDVRKGDNPFANPNGVSLETLGTKLSLKDGKFSDQTVQDYIAKTLFSHMPESYSYGVEIKQHNYDSQVCDVFVIAKKNAHDQVSATSGHLRFVGLTVPKIKSPIQVVSIAQFLPKNTTVNVSSDFLHDSTVFAIKDGKFTNSKVQEYVDNLFVNLPQVHRYKVWFSTDKEVVNYKAFQKVNLCVELYNSDIRVQTEIGLTGFSNFTKKLITADVHELSKTKHFFRELKTLTSIKKALKNWNSGKFANTYEQDYVVGLFDSLPKNYELEVVDLNANDLSSVYQSDGTFAYSVEIRALDEWGNISDVVEIKFINFAITAAKKTTVHINADIKDNPFSSNSSISHEAISDFLSVDSTGKFVDKEINAYLTGLFTDVPAQSKFTVTEYALRDEFTNEYRLFKMQLSDKVNSSNVASLWLVFKNFPKHGIEVKTGVVVDLQKDDNPFVNPNGVSLETLETKLSLKDGKFSDQTVQDYISKVLFDRLPKSYKYVVDTMKYDNNKLTCDVVIKVISAETEPTIAKLTIKGLTMPNWAVSGVVNAHDLLADKSDEINAHFSKIPALLETKDGKFINPLMQKYADKLFVHLPQNRHYKVRHLGELVENKGSQQPARYLANVILYNDDISVTRTVSLVGFVDNKENNAVINIDVTKPMPNNPFCKSADLSFLPVSSEFVIRSLITDEEGHFKLKELNDYFANIFAKVNSNGKYDIKYISDDDIIDAKRYHSTDKEKIVVKVTALTDQKSLDNSPSVILEISGFDNFRSKKHLVHVDLLTSPKLFRNQMSLNELKEIFSYNSNDLTLRGPANLEMRSELMDYLRNLFINLPQNAVYRVGGEPKIDSKGRYNVFVEAFVSGYNFATVNLIFSNINPSLK